MCPGIQGYFSKCPGSSLGWWWHNCPNRPYLGLKLCAGLACWRRAVTLPIVARKGRYRPHLMYTPHVLIRTLHWCVIVQFRLVVPADCHQSLPYLPPERIQHHPPEGAADRIFSWSALICWTCASGIHRTSGPSLQTRGMRTCRTYSFWHQTPPQPARLPDFLDQPPLHSRQTPPDLERTACRTWLFPPE